MNHKEWVFRRLRIVRLLLAAMGAVLALSASAQVRTVETPVATLRMSEATGDLIGLRWKSPSLEIVGESRLGENFRLLIPQDDYQANYFNSKDQNVSRIEATPDGVLCSYDSLRNNRETLPVKVRYRIKAVDGQIHFSIEVDNPTDRKLAEVMYGMIGGQKGIGDRRDTRSMVPGANDNMSPSLLTRFRGGFRGGNFGIPYDAMTFTYPGAMSMGWIDIYNQRDGIGYYYANQDSETRLTLLNMELRPFGKASDPKDDWPSPSELPAGQPIGMTMGWVNLPYLSNGTFTSGPVALEVHKGDWHEASKIYRAWFDQHFAVARAPDWLRKENAWQSIILSNNGDEVLHRFDELPKLAADAKKYGITTFEILGWDTGGIDRGYPQYRPNPRLGTPEEFRKALAELHVMGVHPLIFSNVQMADTATPLFQNNLKQYAVDGRFAPDWTLFGWGEGTISARAGLARSNMALVSSAHPEFRKLLMDQYLQLVRDGADGFQLDKTGGVAQLDFNKQLPVSPDKSLPQGVLDTFKELLPAARKINPGFSLAGEVWFDRSLPYVDVSYMRMGSIDIGSTVLRYTFPEWTSTIFGETPADYHQMNNGMRYGFVWDLSPRYYTASVDEPATRPLARYVSELIRIRKQYADLLFFGRFNDTMGAAVAGGPDIRYSVFDPLQQGSRGRACVVVNFGTEPESAEVHLDGFDGEVTIATPFEADRKATLPLKVTIPPNTVEVIVKR